MNSHQINSTMGVLHASTLLLCGVVLIQLFAAQIDAQISISPWKTLNGDAPLVIARGGFSGIYPDSSLDAYRLATQTSLAGVVQWCDVQLTQDEIGICFPYLDFSGASNIPYIYPVSNKTYIVNGVPTNGWFTIDFSSRDLSNVSLIQGIASRSPIFDANGYKILTIQDVATEMKQPQGFWLNVQNDAFYAQHNLNMSKVLLSISKSFNINFISSPEVNVFEKIAGHFGRNGPIFVFQFPEEVEFGTPFIDHTIIVPEISPVDGIYSFSLTWPEIRNLTPAISNPFSRKYNIFRNPKEKNSGRLILLSKFLNLAKNSASLSGVLISVEYAAYLREKQGLDVIKAVLDTLTETGYSNGTNAMKVLIQSADSSVLVEFKKQSKYETVYKIKEIIGDIFDSAVEDIKKFANAVVINRNSVFPSYGDGFLTRQTSVVQKLQKSQIPVYVEVFRNEFIGVASDFFSDATVQINSYIFEAGINGTITDFPFTAARFRRNRCLGFKEIPPYMSAVKPGGLLSTLNPLALPPAEPPKMAFTDDDVSEPPLPSVIAKAPTSTLGTPSPGTPSTNAHAPSGQIRLTLSLILSVFCLSSTFLINLLISSPLSL